MTLAEIPDTILLAKSKPVQSLYEHTKIVILTLLQIYNNLPEHIQRIPKLKEAGILAVIFHDCGKAHPDFQNMIRLLSNNWENRRHEIISSNFFALILSYNQSHPLFQSVIDKDWYFPIWMAIILHHKAISTDAAEKSKVYLDKVKDIDRIPFELKNKRFISDMKSMCQNIKQIKQYFQEIEGFFSKNETIKNLFNTVFRNMNFNFPEKISEIDLDLTNFFEAYCGLTRNNLFMDKDELFESSYWASLLFQNRQYQVLPDWNLRYKVAILLGLLKTADHMGSGEFVPLDIPKFENFPQQHKLRPFQQKVGQTLGSLVLRAPTGSGKTEAAIAWVQRNQRKNGRFFYVLPFQASLNAMYKRLYDFTNDPMHPENILVGISHSRNLEFLVSFFENSGETPQTAFHDAIALRSLVKEVYFPIKVSTAHQLLRFILFGKGWETLLLELTDSTIVFDEIHAYEPRILGFLIGMMKILREFNAKFLIMTATIPNFIVQLIKNQVFSNDNLPELSLDPSNEQDRLILERKRHRFHLLDGEIFEYCQKTEWINLIYSRYKDTKTQLFICNTVKSAQELYEWFKNKSHLFNHDRVLLFHSRFNAKDRAEIETKISNQSKMNLILIATQVVEVSLDISYDYGYFEIAPIDALIQRMGRVNRQNQSTVNIANEENIIIFTKGKHDTFIYQEDLVKKTYDELVEMQDRPISEKEWVRKVDKVYPAFTDDDRKEYERGFNHSMINKYKEKFEIGFQQEWVLELIENADRNVDVLPQESLSEFEDLWRTGKYLEAKKLLLSVDIRIFHGEKLEFLDRYRVFTLKSPHFQYNREFGLKKVEAVD